MADLLDLAKYKSLMGVQPGNTRDDTQINALLAAASNAVRSYTGRRFEVASAPATARTFTYDGSGYLDVDDYTDLAQVEVLYAGADPYTLPTNPVTYSAKPDRETSDDPPHTHIEFYGLPARGGSPEMGFERNMDQLPWATLPTSLRVTALWGWPAVPEDVKLAAAITIKAWVEGPADDNLTAEAIAGFSRSWASAMQRDAMLAIPNKARDLLAAYALTF